MREIGKILLIVLFFTGCSVSRKEAKSISGNEKINTSQNIYRRVESQNLTARSFFVEKAEFSIKSGDDEKSGIGTIKFLKPDKFLLSIKSKAGIEVARIYLNGDSITVNDRINKRVYYGSTSYLKGKYGISTGIIPIILGDYVSDIKQDSTRVKCDKGNAVLEGIIRDIKIRYLIDCNYGKSVQTVPEGIGNEGKVEITYSDFFMANDINTPGKIEIHDKESNTTIEIKIIRIISPWEGIIEFVPGKQYDKINLL